MPRPLVLQSPRTCGKQPPQTAKERESRWCWEGALFVARKRFMPYGSQI